MNAINKIILTITLTMGASAALAQTSKPASHPSAPDISGTYACDGSDPYSTPPNFKETIIFKKIGDTYNIQMIHSGSVTPYDFGTGIVHKDVPNALSFVYWDPKDTRTKGTELLEIKADGSLVGVYADHSKDKVGTQTCVKSKM